MHNVSEFLRKCTCAFGLFEPPTRRDRLKPMHICMRVIIIMTILDPERYSLDSVMKGLKQSATI
jgi:hypothetical protein